jgi:hypothetical protein
MEVNTFPGRRKASHIWRQEKKQYKEKYGKSENF